MIPEEVVEAICRETASFSPAAARREFDRLVKRQPALLAFVMAQSHGNLSRHGVELANYVFFVIARMFYAAVPKIRRISPKTIEDCSNEIEASMASLVGAHDRFLERAAMALSGRQPYVFRYLTEALLEPRDDDDPLTEDDSGGIFMTLATVIKALDEKGIPQGVDPTTS